MDENGKKRTGNSRILAALAIVMVGSLGIAAVMMDPKKKEDNLTIIVAIVGLILFILLAIATSVLWNAANPPSGDPVYSVSENNSLQLDLYNPDGISSHQVHILVIDPGHRMVFENTSNIAPRSGVRSPVPVAWQGMYVFTAIIDGNATYRQELPVIPRQDLYLVIFSVERNETDLIPVYIG